MSPHFRLRRWLAEHLPDTPLVRVPIGLLLVLGGLLGFLPVLGFWMLPLGLMVLAFDFPPARKLARKLYVKIGRWMQRRRKRALLRR